MPKPVISFKEVTKYYGKSLGIKKVNLEVMPGEVFGFLGPNGAGKTTSISLMVDLTRPTSGKISIFGLDSVDGSLAIRQRIGFLTDDMALDKGLTGWQQLEYFGSLRGVFDKKYVRELANSLSCNLNRKFKTLSRGNRQKVALISALMHDPDLLILDEPTSGLDPIVQQEFNKVILDRKSQGKTTFISSHILSEVQEICDRVAFIREGKIIAIQGLAEIGENLPKRVHLHSFDKALVQKIKKLAGTTDFKHVGNVMEFMYTGDVNKLTALLSQHKLLGLTVTEADLENIFMKYYKGSDV